MQSISSLSKGTSLGVHLIHHLVYNYVCPSNVNAALGCAQLENLDKYVASKRRLQQNMKH